MKLIANMNTSLASNKNIWKKQVRDHSSTADSVLGSTLMCVPPSCPPLLGTVNKLEHAKVATHKRLTGLLIIGELVDDHVPDAAEIIHRRNEVLSGRQEEERGEQRPQNPVRGFFTALFPDSGRK